MTESKVQRYDLEDLHSLQGDRGIFGVADIIVPRLRSGVGNPDNFVYVGCHGDQATVDRLLATGTHRSKERYQELLMDAKGVEEGTGPWNALQDELNWANPLFLYGFRPGPVTDSFSYSVQEAIAHAVNSELPFRHEVSNVTTMLSAYDVDALVLKTNKDGHRFKFKERDGQREALKAVFTFTGLHNTLTEDIGTLLGN